MSSLVIAIPSMPLGAICFRLSPAKDPILKNFPIFALLQLRVRMLSVPDMQPVPSLGEHRFVVIAVSSSWSTCFFCDTKDFPQKTSYRRYAFLLFADDFDEGMRFGGVSGAQFPTRERDAHRRDTHSPSLPGRVVVCQAILSK